MKREAINHTKMRRLARSLGIELWGARGIMESIWYVTKEEAPAGDIGKLSDQDIADAIGWQGDAGQLVAGLVSSRWIEENEFYRMIIHDWPDHCEDHIHARIARSGLRFANGAIPNLNKLTKSDREKYCNVMFLMPPMANGKVPAALHEVPAALHGDSIETSQTRTLPYLTIPNHTEPAVGVSPEKIEPEAPIPFRSLPSWTLDETFTPFVEAWRRVEEVTGKPLLEEDFTEAHYRWGRMDFDQKCLAIKTTNEHLGLNVWTGATVQYIPLPARYLEKEYKRPVVAPKPREQPQSTYKQPVYFDIKTITGPGKPV